MANIVLGLFTTHGPTLNVPAAEWIKSVPKDQGRRHWYRGREYSYAELLEGPSRVVSDEILALGTLEQRFQACQRSIDRMAQAWQSARPDVCVIFGNDQRELIQENNQPALSVFTGANFFHEPLSEHRATKLPPGVKEAEWGYRPQRFTEYEAVPDLAQVIFDLARDRGFDLAAHAHWGDTPPDHMHTGTPHAFGFVLQRIMGDRVVPTLPLLINTFYPPNQPSAKRCFQFGRFIGEAIAAWKAERRVAVVASGGLSHFVIDEELDRRLIAAINDRDEHAVVDFDQAALMSGTSELRSWIGAAGALFGAPLTQAHAEYIPCYRSRAGTGAGNGFVVWA